MRRSGSIRASAAAARAITITPKDMCHSLCQTGFSLVRSPTLKRHANAAPTSAPAAHAAALLGAHQAQDHERHHAGQAGAADWGAEEQGQQEPQGIAVHVL